MDQLHHVIQQPCQATDGLSYSLYTGGLHARVGDQTQWSAALLDRYIQSLDKELHSTSDCEHCHIALDGHVNLFPRLGWLQSSEKICSHLAGPPCG